MITFFCKTITEEDLVRCTFDLNRTEYKLLLFMLREHSALAVSAIAAKLNLERTSVQKAVKGLMAKGLVRRTQKNLPKGGYIFFYMPDDKEAIKARMKSIVMEWYKSVEKSIDNF